MAKAGPPCQPGATVMRRAMVSTAGKRGHCELCGFPHVTDLAGKMSVTAKLPPNKHMI